MADAATARVAAGGRPLAGLRAIVVEDDYFIASDLKRLLHRRGADEVRLSGSLDDGLRQIREGGFDFALLDLNLHGEMAFSLADELARRRVPFGFVSGYGASAIPRRFASVPNWGKPHDEERIVSDVQHLWSQSQGGER